MMLVSGRVVRIYTGCFLSLSVVFFFGGEVSAKVAGPLETAGDLFAGSKAMSRFASPEHQALSRQDEGRDFSGNIWHLRAVFG